jgi:hypothetical protein
MNIFIMYFFILKKSTRTLKYQYRMIHGNTRATGITFSKVKWASVYFKIPYDVLIINKLKLVQNDLEKTVGVQSRT